MANQITITLDVPNSLLYEVFVTALEGGIGYWSVCNEYRIGYPDKTGEDHEGFRADIVETETHIEGDEEEEVRIDRGVVLLGLTRVVQGSVRISPRIYQDILLSVRQGHSGHIDSEAADCIVQAGLFDDIVYG
tara:strand:+ start:598 stop:996 length:399 start_codon:yes stop_codon:yes gene_type:complete